MCQLPNVGYCWSGPHGTILPIFQGYVLVYDVTNFDSFVCMDKLKKEIDKHKEKKEVSQ